MPGKRYKSSRKVTRNRTYPLVKRSQSVERPIRNPKPQWGRMAIGVAFVAAFTVPIFRSGLKTNLTFWEWLINHTVFGDPVEYIPEEDYTAIFSEPQGEGIAAVTGKKD